ncbi:hypothetical protein L1049_013341 [Liquidambar formosana]|uniref:Transcription repressor n=1 Tax=Liquidambar formosana TaxID=63359 RepID=A0AAP0RPT8_LIQFO
MFSNKTKLLRNIFPIKVADCGCGRSKLSDIYQPKPKPKPSILHQNPTLHHSSSSSWDRGGDEEEEDHTTSTTFSLTINDASPLHSEPENDPTTSKMVSPCPNIGQSLAVVKDSDDPYHDFRQSMLQMILEKQLYSRDDLEKLLGCFLQLNSPRHHDIIVRAFMEIWNEVISSRQQISHETVHSSRRVT